MDSNAGDDSRAYRDKKWPDYEKTPDAEEFRKLFVGGLDGKTTDESLKEYFQTYGAIDSCDIVKEKNNQSKSKGFAFITFKSEKSIDEIQKNRPHEVDGKKCETKRATPKAFPYWATTKLYFKGFDKEDDEEKLIADVKEYFGEFGEIKGVNLPKEKEGGSLKGFGFIEFNEQDPVDKLNLRRKVNMKGKTFDVAKAFSQEKPKGGYGYGPFEYYYYPPDFYYYYDSRYARGDYYHGGNRRGFNRGGGGRPFRGGRF